MDDGRYLPRCLSSPIIVFVRARRVDCDTDRWRVHCHNLKVFLFGGTKLGKRFTPLL